MIVCTLCAGLAVIIAFFNEEIPTFSTKASFTTSLLPLEKAVRAANFEEKVRLFSQKRWLRLGFSSGEAVAEVD